MWDAKIQALPLLSWI